MKYMRLYLLSFSLIIIAFSLIFSFFIANYVTNFSDRFHIEDQKQLASITLSYNKQLFDNSDSKEEQDLLVKEFETINRLQGYLWLFDSYKNSMIRSIVFSTGILSFGLLLCWHLSLYLILRKHLTPLSQINHSLQEYLKTGKIKAIQYQSTRAMNKLVNQFNKLLSDLRNAKIRDKLRSQVSGWQNIARVMGHEIKNKLSPVKLTLDYIQDRFDREEAGMEFQSELSLISRNVGFIEKILFSLKGLSNLPPADFRSSELTIDVENMLDEQFDFKCVRHMTDEGRGWIVFTDPFYLQLILTNLIKNSIEASSVGTRDISIFYGVRETYLTLTVRDNGEGFDMTEAADLFKPGQTTKAEGDGLGLFIVDELCRALSIGLKYHSGRGSGTTFELHFSDPQRKEIE
jgi:signal transduction histidine kinase